ncbi:unannotated protein [freshwater metagenome]|uniref:Unannotated protein n=1 Tax=freshwater metagenome TaxID=449393 RepID=A0A6J7C7A6_9ZZZZ
MELCRDAEGVFSADGDEGIDPERGEVGLDPVDPTLDLHGVRAARTQDRAPAGEDTADLGDSELGGEPLEGALPAITEAQEVVAVLGDTLAHDGTDDRVESGAIPASGEYSDAHDSPPMIPERDRNTTAMPRPADTHPTAPPAPMQGRASVRP